MRLKGKETGVYLGEVMKKVFSERWEEHLKKLLGGDPETLDYCAQRLKQNLDFYPLVHTLCLVTGQKFDLEEKDKLKAADKWLEWYGENKESLAWSKDTEVWRVKS